MPDATFASILESCGRIDCLALFEENEISIAQLAELTLEDLKEIGIDKLGHRKSILAAIQAAFAESAPPASGGIPAEGKAGPAPADATAAVPCDASQRPKVFLSYGRKDAREVAERIERDLIAAGYEVWLDVKRIGSGSQWQQEIEQGLRDSQVVVSLLSPHAVRTVGEDVMDSVCLDELTFARTSCPPTPVVPAMVVPCEPPFIIYRLDYVHLTGWRDSDEEYRDGFERLVSGIRDALSGKVRYRLWEDRLRPLDFSDYLAQKRQGFVGREWLFEEIDLWRFESDERALLVTGDPGAGKSSIVAQLVHANPGGQVIAYHCCQSDNLETLRPARFIQNLAAMIASRLPAYAEQLDVPAVKEALDDKRCESDPGGAFLDGILQPLNKLPAPEEGVRYILVDALDEALTHSGGVTIVDILAGRMERLPSWLRILATTRNEPAVIQRLSGLRAKNIQASDPRNLADLAVYIRQRLSEHALAERLAGSRINAEKVIEQISQKSSGNFLYAVNALNSIARDHYSFAGLNALPRGLDGLYLDFFRRIFGDSDAPAYGQARPLLQVLCAAREPLSRAELAAASGIDPDDDLPGLLRKLAQLFTRRARPDGEESVALYHKSLADWLVSDPDHNAFAISPGKGSKRLASYCKQVLSAGRSAPGWYVRRHAVRHFLETGDWDSAAGALADLGFIEARAKAQELSFMLKDYAAAAELLPEGQARRNIETSRKAELDRYAREMAEYIAASLSIRKGIPEKKPMPPLPVQQVRMWTNEEIAAERKRMTEAPNRLDLIKAFKVFVATHVGPLQDYSVWPGFVASLARNDAPAGPVHQEGEKNLNFFDGVKLIKNFPAHELYNPLPACQAILEDGGNLMALSADGRRIVGAGWLSPPRVWDSESGECLRVLQGHTRSVISITLSPDGRLLASGSHDRTLRIWDLESGGCIRVLEGHSRKVCCSAIHIDGRHAVSGSSDKTLRVWNIESGECIKVLPGHRGSIEVLLLSPDGRYVLSGSSDSTLRIWDFESGKCLKVLEEHSGPVSSMLLTLDGGRVVSGGEDTTLRVWDIASGASLKVLRGHTQPISSIILSQDNRRVISASKDATLRIWDIDSGDCLTMLEGHGESTECVALSLDGRRVVSGSSDNTVRVWDTESGKCLRVLDGHGAGIGSVAFSKDGRHVFSASSDRTLRVWDIELGECLKKIPEQHEQAVHLMLFSANGSRVVSGGEDTTLRIWDTQSHKCLAHLKGHSRRVSVIALTPDERNVVSGSIDGTLRLWDAESGECLNVFEGHKKIGNAQGIYSIAIHRDGTSFISGGTDQTLRIWDIDSGRFLKVLEGHGGTVLALLAHQDRRRVISGSADKTLRIWDIKSGQCLKILEGYKYSVDQIALSPDGLQVVTGTTSHVGHRPLEIWDLESGKCIHELEGHKNGMQAVAFSPDGRRIISGGGDGAVRIWNVKSGKCSKVLDGHKRGVIALALSPDGRHALSGSWDDIRLWNIESGECLSIFFRRDLAHFIFNPIKRCLSLGFTNGRIEFFYLENLPLPGPVITTAEREMVSEDLPGSDVTARPPCCGEKITIPAAIAGRIGHWSSESDDGGFDDPAMLLDCPSCGTRLRINPFFINIQSPIQKP